MKSGIVVSAIALLVSLAPPSQADVKLPAIFGDHMVIQRDMPFAIWGSADAGENVIVKAAGKEKSAEASAAGDWRVVLDPIKSDKPIEITVAGKNTIRIEDVLVGEVWLCSGQSNMGFSLARATGAEAALKAADRPTMRLFTVGRDAITGPPGTEMTGKWEVCTPQTARAFSAVGYFFGEDLHNKLEVPVGLINSSWGGTRAEAWIPKPAFEALKLPYEPAWTEVWLNPKPTQNPKTPPRATPQQAPAALFDGMIQPLAGYRMRGAVWYQGETNTAHPADYRDVLATLIKSWRSAWGQGDFPFLVVQLPNFLGKTRDWPTLRASQAAVAKELPNVGLAVTIDLGETKDIHPKAKQPVGQRLAALALMMAYGRDVPFTGPVFKSMRVEGAEAVVSFNHATGLMAKDGVVKGFEVAGSDGMFVSADARIDGETVRVAAASVQSPKAVRYGWANDPTCTLYNAPGLPAAPFATSNTGG